MSRSPELDLAALRADDRVIWTEDVLRFSDTDANGHVNNAAFAVFCESGRVNLLNNVLWPIREAGGYFVIASLNIQFRAELHFPGRVRCGTWLSGLGRTSVRFGQALLNDAGALVATSDAVTVAMDGPTRRPAPLGPDLRTALDRLVRSDG